MNVTEAMRLINLMADTSSRTEKERLLGELVADDFGKWILKATYNPFVTYGLTPPRQESGPKASLEFTPGRVGPLLDKLSNRELTGHAALREVAEVMECLKRPGDELLWRILSKDLKCGIAATTINTVIPDLVPVFSVMRAHTFAEKKIKSFPVAVEPKMDGIRITFLARDGHGGFFTRSGNRLEAFDHLVPVMKSIANRALNGLPVEGLSASAELRNLLVSNNQLNFMVDCEAIAGNRYETIGTSKRHEKGDDLVLHAFDIMSYADFDAIGSVGFDYKTRRRLLEEFQSFALPEMPFTLTPTYLVGSVAEIQHYYGKFLERGLEGAMVKKLDGLYDKSKTYGWMKLKPEDTEDLPIVGAFEGKPGTDLEGTLGGVIVQRQHEGKPVDVRVGGGFKRPERDALWKLWEQDAAIVGIDPLVGEKGVIVNLSTYPGASFKLLTRLLEVEFQQVSVYGSLEHPRAVRFRDDKAGEVQKKVA